MTFEEIYNQVKDIKEWMGREDCYALYERAGQLKNALIVEIGSYKGISTKVMALASPTSKVIAIDPYVAFFNMPKPEEIMKTFLETVKGLNVELIRDKAENVKWNKPIDFLHIDGDHRYAVLKKDIELFYPHLKKAGWMYVHDYTVGGLEEEGGRVKEVMDELFGSKVLVISGFGCIQKDE